MKIICVLVSSVNGKSTKDSDPNVYKWSSKEDSKHFFNLIETNSCIIMGRGTYENAKHLMKHRPGRLRIILTKSPESHKKDTITGQLEFTSEPPIKLVERLKHLNFTQALLVGGSQVNSAFIKDNLIDELLLTLEPFIFGQGIPTFAENSFNQKLKLLSIEKLNSQGTLLLKYRVK